MAWYWLVLIGMGCILIYLVIGTVIYSLLVRWGWYGKLFNYDDKEFLVAFWAFVPLGFLIAAIGGVIVSVLKCLSDKIIGKKHGTN